ncbi:MULTISPECIES: putative quinol monooxygenase [unclassified Cryobacterium]|uniref:putative quinol monooxygenase n=1 Tax=unclassified Cryobacterium TaxID=2649013 RepID=UPI00106DC6B2|nr:MULTISPECIES: putative quinol monooxygenase [unclassified Cryobacterium]TFB96693.1 antibiotic biosynthesis monooxygenase [Cryobacterium sp. MDB2-A-1]TFC10562.1 antibiotic biosynthesis monooxygenase [Cryobacterium sp. MDB2-33-2]TFC12978.1 antibiotic biosynthesis monooxygenase [Cryobacterium sp. MDB2-A-2]TFC17172.1 antibiotic biosynthesis monooxygenase [Cryobacterium sp. MDB2-10]TFC23246.1 antibiotic biosynthesis monooxygenase [Cryobacterium sp. MDB1-18-2]
MPEPVVVTAYFTPAAGQHAALTHALSVAIAEVHTEPGCELYAIHDAPDGRIVMIEKWSSAELLDDHGTSPATARLVASVEGLLSAPTEVTRLVPIPAGTLSQGAL